MEIAEKKQIVEAVLFAAGHAVPYDRLALLFEETPGEVKKFIREFADEYNSPENERGIQLIAYDDRCQLCTKEEYIEYIRAALGIRRGGNLSNSSLEVLSIVAYHQPVTRAFIEQVRGIDSSYALSTLAEKGLIETCGRLDAPGRPSLYATTDDFLRCFGLSSVKDLPSVTVGDEQMSTDEQMEILAKLEKEAAEAEETEEEQA